MSKRSRAEFIDRDDYQLEMDLYYADAFDVPSIQGELHALEHPFFTMSKKPEMNPKVYQYGDKTIEFKPSTSGFPTIYDKDLIVYALSHLVRRHRELEEEARADAHEKGIEFDPSSVAIPKGVTFDATEFLRFVGRGVGGNALENLKLSIDRIHGSSFKTNIDVGSEKRRTTWQHIVGDISVDSREKRKKIPNTDEYKTIEVPDKITVEVGNMLADVLEKRRYLVLSPDYFKLPPMARRSYEIGRKHLGRKAKFEISLAKLHVKSGSRMRLFEYRGAIKKLCEKDELPDIRMELVSNGKPSEDKVVFTSKEKYLKKIGDGTGPARKDQSKEDSTQASLAFGGLPALKPDTIERAKQILPTGVDVYTVEDEWRSWAQHKVSKGEQITGTVDSAFMGFVKGKYAASALV